VEVVGVSKELASTVDVLKRVVCQVIHDELGAGTEALDSEKLVLEVATGA
jgi:hypothetical protein